MNSEFLCKPKKVIIDLLFYTLLFVTFFMSGNNYPYMVFFQLFFIVAMSISYKKEFIGFYKESKFLNKIIYVLIIISISISYFLSPILEIKGLHNELDGMLFRYISSVCHFLFFVSFLVYLKKTSFNFIKFEKSLLIIFTLITFIFLTKNNFPYSLIGLNIFGDNIRHFGYLYTFFLSILMSHIAWYFINKNKIRYGLNLILFSIISFTIFFTFIGGRGAFISIALSILLLIVLLKKENKKLMIDYFKSVLFIISISLFLSSIFSETRFSENLFDKTNQVGVMKKKLTLENFDTNRLYIWGQVIKNNDNYFFGLGPNSFKYIKDKDKKLMDTKAIQPHNSILQFYLEWGLLGTFLICIGIFINLKKIYITLFLKKDYSRENLASLSVCSSLICHSFFDGTLFYSQTVLLIIIFMVLGNHKNKQDKVAS